MARVSILDRRVRELVDRKLVPLFLAEGSTASLCKLLNQNDGGSVGGTIHPNRLHALLSDDIARGVNEATLVLIEQAVEAILVDNADLARRSDTGLSELRAQARHLRDTGRLPDRAIIKQLGMPPAVAREVLSTPLRSTSLDPKVYPKSQSEDRRKATLPDWRFQDTAVANSLASFRQRPHAKVGLILPTGAGKTRTALRICLEKLANAPTDAGLVYWVTHRKNLRKQAHRELQKLLSISKAQVPNTAASLLANRIRFVMVGDLPKILADDTIPPVLVVVDEAHHAAARSYQPIFSTNYPIPALFLTATPNRTDLQPIGIDEIAFTITYRELEERGCVVVPQFVPFPVQDFDWSELQVRDLADYVIDRAESEFTKVLVFAPRIDRVEEFYEALITALSLAALNGHPLDSTDIGFIHAEGNSLYVDNDDFLKVFAEKPRAILISAQLLLEGFDDPAINTVVLTYPTSSLVRLMQAAGRCVRYSPGKDTAYVVQARQDELAYYFDQRWLYEEINDYLRPDLIDINYTSLKGLQDEVATLLSRHNVNGLIARRVMDRLTSVTSGDTCRILLYGLPYFGAAERFADVANWGAFLEHRENSKGFRGIFNAFSNHGALLSDPSDFLTREGARFGISKDLTSGSDWVELMQVLTASHLAREEIYGSNPMAKASRPSKRHGPTTWLRYVTFHFRPQLPPQFSDFLSDCYNRAQLAADYLANTTQHAVVVKIPLPLGGMNEGWLLSEAESFVFDASLAALSAELRNAEPCDQFGALAKFLVSCDNRLLPSRILMHIDAYLGEEDYAARVLNLQDLYIAIKGAQS